MKNISGNAGSWDKSEKDNETTSTINTKSNITVSDAISPIIINLEDNKRQIKEYYCLNPRKEFYNALINLQLALDSLKRLI